MNRQSTLTFLAPLLVAGAIPTAFFSLDPTLDRIRVDEWVQVGAWVVFTLAFEFVVLLPMSYFFRAAKHFRLTLFCASWAVWFVLWIVWFRVVFDLPFVDVMPSALRLGLAGFMVCGTFVLLSRRKPSTNAIK